VDENGGKIDRDVYPGSKISIKIELENSFDDESIEDIDIEGVLEDIDDGSDIVEEDDINKIKALDEKTVTLDFEIPLEVEEEDYDLEIEAKGKDKDGNYHYDSVEFTVKVEKKSHDLIIQKAQLNPTTISCTGRTSLNVKILNIGENDEDDVVLKIKNNELGIYLERTGIKLDKDIDDDNKYRKTFNLGFNKGIKSGIYLINVEVYYDGTRLIDTKTTELIVNDCAKKIKTSSYSNQVIPKSDMDLGKTTKTNAKKTPVTKHSVYISFGETSTYIMLLLITLVVLLGLIIFGIGFIYYSLKKR
jgi:ribosomal protein L25 (general stress protein Ctc)